MAKTDIQKQDTKSALVSAGLRLIAEHGYHGTKVSDIVRKCGVTQGTFYWYFKSKLEMALEVIEQGKVELLKAAELGFRKEYVSREEMLANSERLIRQLLWFAQQNREFMLILMVRGHAATNQVDDAIIATRAEFHKALYRNLAQASNLKMLPARETRYLHLQAVFVQGLIESAFTWWLFGHQNDIDHSPEISPDEFAELLVKFEFFGLMGMPE